MGNKFNLKYYDHRISSGEFLQESSENFNNKTISNVMVLGNQNNSRDINEYVFNNVIFKNVTFMYGKFNNCVFNNCKFNNCDIFDYCVKRNTFNACHFDNISFFNNTDVIYNKFIGCTGNIGNYFARDVRHNIFMNMDFSGFLPFYLALGSEIRWHSNYFINTTVNVNALKNVSENVEEIFSGCGFFLHGQRVMDCDMYPCLNDYDEFLVVQEMYGEMGSIRIDLKGVDDITKLNLISNCFVNIQVGNVLRGIETDHDGNIIPLKIGKISAYTVPNPRPIKIVDNRGYVLNEGVIKNISFTDRYIPECGDVYDYGYDGIKLKSCNEESNILNPDNYSCRALVRKQSD